MLRILETLRDPAAMLRPSNQTLNIGETAEQIDQGAAEAID
jgi:hypothetical protein